MIYLIEINNGTYEGKKIVNGRTKEMMLIYNIYDKLGKKCLMLYKYKLPDITDTHLYISDCMVNPKEIKNKFGATCPDKFDFDKFKTDYIMLYDLSIYIDKLDKLDDLFNYCSKNNMDIILPIYDNGNRGISNSWYNYTSDLELLSKDIIKLVNNYNHRLYKSADDFYRPMERSIKLSLLLE